MFVEKNIEPGTTAGITENTENTENTKPQQDLNNGLFLMGGLIIIAVVIMSN